MPIGELAGTVEGLDAGIAGIVGLGSGEAPERLAIRAFRDGDRHTLVVRGELDLSSAPRFEEAIARVFAQAPGELMLELSRLEFIDSAGLDAVLSTRSLCAQHGCRLCLTPAEKPAQRVFDLLRLADHLPFRRQRRAAVAEAV